MDCLVKIAFCRQSIFLREYGMKIKLLHKIFILFLSSTLFFSCTTLRDYSTVYNELGSKNYDLAYQQLEAEKESIYTDKDETTSHQQIKKAFRMHYASKLATAESQLRKDLFISLIFLVTGILFLGLYLVSIFHDWHLAVSSILDIVAWVFLWEFVDKFAIQNSFTRLQKKRYLRLVKAEVSIRTRAY